jgi:hypothetical protein
MSPAITRAMAQNQPTIVLNPVSAAATVNATSAGIDTTGYEGVMALVIQTGAVTGSIDWKVQDSADNSTFADVAGLTVAQITAANKINTLTFVPGQVRRYIKLVGTIGTGPVLVAAALHGVKKAR